VAKGTITLKHGRVDEMMEGIAAMKSHREGKITLRTYKRRRSRKWTRN
jgi:hypothetical protein